MLKALVLGITEEIVDEAAADSAEEQKNYGTDYPGMWRNIWEKKFLADVAWTQSI